MNVKLLCHKKNKKCISDILFANNIIVDDTSSIILCEESFQDESNYDIKIVFRISAISELANFFQGYLSSQLSSNIILGKYNDTYTPINMSEISYFNGLNNDTYANVSNGKKYLVKNKLYQLEEMLSGKSFFRINKSELINIKKITLIIPMFKGKLLVNLEGYKPPFDISRGYTQDFKKRLGL